MADEIKGRIIGGEGKVAEVDGGYFGGARDRRLIELTSEHVRWKKVSVAGAMELFPHECIGGGNKSDKARYCIVVQFDGGKLVRTDVDGPKKIVRDRAGAGEFFSRMAAKADDFILITRIAVYRYNVSLLRRVGAE